MTPTRAKVLGQSVEDRREATDNPRSRDHELAELRRRIAEWKASGKKEGT